MIDSLRKAQGLCQIYNELQVGVAEREKVVEQMRQQLDECMKYL